MAFSWRRMSERNDTPYRASWPTRWLFWTTRCSSRSSRFSALANRTFTLAKFASVLAACSRMNSIVLSTFIIYSRSTTCRVHPLRSTRVHPGYHCARCDNIQQTQGKQDLPAKRHQLVIPEAGQRAAQPDIKKEEAENLQAEPNHGQNDAHPVRPERRTEPPAEK